MKESNETIVDTVLNLKGASQYDLWKYYQGRADQIKERLWTSGTWLIAVGAVILGTHFSANLMKITNDAIPLQTDKPLPVFFLSLFGVLVSIYAFAVVIDYENHIKSNWTRADYLKRGRLKGLRFSTTGSYTLKLILALQMVAHVGIVLLATLGRCA